MNEQITLKIKEIAAEQLDRSIASISDHAVFMDDLGADSLDVTEMIMTMEDKFELEIPDEDADKLLTVSAAIQYVANRLDPE